MKTPDPLIEELHQLRTEAGLSVWETEKKADLGTSTVSKWESGTYGPTVHGLRKLAAVFGLRLALVPVSEVEQLHAETVARLELELVPDRPSSEYPPITPAQALENLRVLAEAVGDWPTQYRQVAS